MAPATFTAPQVEDPLLARAYERLLHGRTRDAMDELMVGLQTRRLSMNDAEWAECVQGCLRHPIRELLHQDPFTYRAFSKPRGYAGDARLLDFIYSVDTPRPLPLGTTDLGREIFQYTIRTPACEGVRARREFLAEALDRLVDEVYRPHVLSIAAGHLREADLSSAVRRKRLGRLVALDSDQESLAEIDRCYRDYRVETVHANIRQLMTRRLDVGLFDFVYATGLLDYLQAAAAGRLIVTMFGLLKPKGRLLVANFLPGILGVGYMEAYMDWRLIYRTRRDMLDVSMDIPQAEIRDIRLWAEENQNIIFLQMARK